MHNISTIVVGRGSKSQFKTKGLNTAIIRAPKVRISPKALPESRQNQIRLEIRETKKEKKQNEASDGEYEIVRRGRRICERIKKKKRKEERRDG